MVLLVHARRKEHRNRVGRCFCDGVSDEAVEFMVTLLSYISPACIKRIPVMAAGDLVEVSRRHDASVACNANCVVAVLQVLHRKVK